VGDSRFEVYDFEVQVQHHLLLAVSIRPRRANIAGRGLDREVCDSAGWSQSSTLPRLPPRFPSRAGPSRSERVRGHLVRRGRRPTSQIATSGRRCPQIRRAHACRTVSQNRWCTAGVEMPDGHANGPGNSTSVSRALLVTPQERTSPRLPTTAKTTQRFR
jgi:hypothetical protein